MASNASTSSATSSRLKAFSFSGRLSVRMAMRSRFSVRTSMARADAIMAFPRMRPYAVIDADSHVEEPAEMWDHLETAYQGRRPIIVTGENRPDLFGMNAFWYVDGKAYPHPVGHGVTIYATPVTMERAQLKPFSMGSQTLCEPLARVKDLDAAGVGVQVNYPTLFLEPLTGDPLFEAALMRAYNSYMGAQCGQAA